jgi:DNA invertase Pin-like site-specific DNA recombinase
MTAHRIGYRRVSTIDQNTARQLEGQQLHKVFEDKASGSTSDRPQLRACLEHLRPGDTLVVHSMDRLARNVRDLLDIVKGLTDRGVRVEFVKEAQVFTGERNPMGDLMLTLLGAVAQFERAILLERQAEGIAIAKAKGKYKGRQPLDAAKVNALRAEAAKPGTVKAELAARYGISRETLYKYLRVA